MAGLIQQQMQGGSAEDEQNEQEPIEGKGPDGSMQHESMEGEKPEPSEMGGGDNEAGPDEESDPAFQQALTIAYEVLYKGDAAKDVAKQLKSAPTTEQGLADIAYNVTSIIDEKTQGKVPNELIAVLGMRILEEVTEIAEAAGVKPTPEDIAGAFKDMILRFLGEQGVDTSQLQQAMDQVDPSVFKQAAEQV